MILVSSQPLLSFCRRWGTRISIPQWWRSSALLLAIAVACPADATAYCVDPPGDMDASGDANVVDVQCEILATLWVLANSEGDPPGCVGGNFGRTDCNCDELTNVTDVLITILLALELNLTAGSDENANNCHDACESDWDCCGANASEPGCMDVGVQACVCEIDLFCCDIIWDEGCVRQAVDECDAGCPDPICGDGECVEPENCDSCTVDCECLGEGSCCGVHSTPGCDNVPVQDCVCAADPYCCTLTWDAGCVARAIAPPCELVCEVVPVCGDGNCEAGESQATCMADCPGAFCNGAVCDPDWPYLETCANCADCGVCVGDCCVGHGGLGCGVPDIQVAVCSQVPTCCSVAWNQLCANLAAGLSTSPCLANVCGDASCDDVETALNCPSDCPAPPP